MKKITATFFLALFMLCGAEAAGAQCASIKFARGRTGAVVSGKVGANRQACYTMRAREGQRMAVHLTSPDRRARFSIAPDGYDADFLEGAVEVADWEGVLTSASGAGEFLIVVEAPRAGAPFTLEVMIPTSRSGGSAARRKASSPCGDFSGDYSTHYGLLRLVRTGNSVSGTYTAEGGGEGTLNGTVHGRVLAGRWKEAGRGGTFIFTLDPDGRAFTGNFAFDGDPNPAGEWGGHCDDGPERP